MGYLILPALVLIFVPTPAARAHQLEDFSRLSRAIGKEVSLVDRSGLIRKGIVEAATADAVTLRFGSAAAVDPARRDRPVRSVMKDGRSDGVDQGGNLCRDHGRAGGSGVSPWQRPRRHVSVPRRDLQRHRLAARRGSNESGTDLSRAGTRSDGVTGTFSISTVAESLLALLMVLAGISAAQREAERIWRSVSISVLSCPGDPE